MTKPPTVHNRRKGNCDWRTPPDLLEATRNVFDGIISLDPASSAEANKLVKAENFFSAEDDGLRHEWRGKVFINPPYTRGLVGKFIDKLLKEFTEGRVDEAICITNAATDTNWFHELAVCADLQIFTRKRIKFLKPDGTIAGTPPCGQCISYLGSNTDKFFEAFARFGIPMQFGANKKISRLIPADEPKKPPTGADGTFGNRLSLPLRIVATFSFH